MAGEESEVPIVDKLCESMQKLFTQLVEQSQKNSAGTIILEPNPVRLSGPGNYFSWSRHVNLILGSHGLKSFLDDKAEKPDDKVKLEQWEQNEQRVMVWLLGSMEPSVREQVENLQTAAEVWKDIEQQLFGKTNKMQVTRVLHEMRHLKQGQKSVTKYAGELKRLYRDLEFFRPFKSNDPKDLALLHEWFQPILVQTFLEGLNDEFNLRRQMIYSTADWPTLDEAISSILEEETRLSNQDLTSHAGLDTRAALSSQTHTPSVVTSKDDEANAAKFEYKKKTRLLCDHCKRSGHIKKNCFELIGYPPGWQQRQHDRFNIGDTRGKKQDRVHLTSSTGELSAAAIQALEEFKSKLMVASAEGPAGSISSFHASRGLLAELQVHVESINIANDLHSVGGLVPVIHYLRNSNVRIRAKAVDVVTTVVQNNPTSQRLVMEASGFEPLISNFISDPDLTARIKALGAISSLIRNNKPGVAAFRLANGYAGLRDALNSESARFQRKALNLTHYLLSESHSDCSVFAQLGFPRLMMRLVSSDDSGVREAALGGLLELARDMTLGNRSLLADQDRLRQLLCGRIQSIRMMAPEDLDAAREERQLVDSLWISCYHEPSTLHREGLLVLPGEESFQ